MSTSVKFVVMGAHKDYGEWEHAKFDTFDEAQALAKRWSVYEDMTWVTKRTTFDHILWSSSTTLPQKEAMPI